MLAARRKKKRTDKAVDVGKGGKRTFKGENLFSLLKRKKYAYLSQRKEKER